LLIVTNTTVAQLYLAKLTDTLASKRVAECILPDGEQHKTLQTAGWVFDALVAKKMNRDATVLALGGGVMATSRASRRPATSGGVGYVQIPTTLLAASRLVGRRQDRSQSPGRQESDRGVLSALR